MKVILISLPSSLPPSLKTQAATMVYRYYRSKYHTDYNTYTQARRAFEQKYEAQLRLAEVGRKGKRREEVEE